MDELQEQYRQIEKLLIESKLQAATLDMECDELTVSLGQKNEQLKRFSTKFTTMEIELVRLQALQGPDDSVEDAANDTDKLGIPHESKNRNFSPNTKSSNAKKGVSSKIKSFFANKFKKQSKDKATAAVAAKAPAENEADH